MLLNRSASALHRVTSRFSFSRVAPIAVLLTGLNMVGFAAEEIAGVNLDASPPAVARQETAAERDARMGWWREAKFGLFIHWGVYAVPAGSYGGTTSYGEWIMHSAKIPVAGYRGFARQFNPTRYDPETWTKIAADAGMRYIVITAKHHDGFALFPSRASAWNVVDASPYGKDLLQPLVNSAHERGLKIGFYYSQAQDWNNPGGAKARYAEGEGWDEAQNGSFDDYLRNVAAPQVRELLQYPIDILWWDTPTWMTPERAAPFAEMLSLRPGLISNNRLGGGYKGDTATPEQFVPATGFSGDWETCMTLNGHWGYNAADENWKSSAELTRKLADICAKGGNFLLNVGPTAEGIFPPGCVERLQEIGRWLRTNGDSIYGTVAGPFPHLSWGVATRKGRQLYLHVFSWPADGILRVPLRSPATGARLLTTGQTLVMAREPGRLSIQVPANAPDPVNSVVIVDLAEDPVAEPLPSAGKGATAPAAAPDCPAANVLDGTLSRVWRAPDGAHTAEVAVDLGTEMVISGCSFDEPDVWPRMKQVVRVDVRRGDGWTQLLNVSTSGHGYVGDFAPVTGREFRFSVECSDRPPALAEVQLFRPE